MEHILKNCHWFVIIFIFKHKGDWISSYMIYISSSRNIPLNHPLWLSFQNQMCDCNRTFFIWNNCYNGTTNDFSGWTCIFPIPYCHPVWTFKDLGIGWIFQCLDILILLVSITKSINPISNYGAPSYRNRPKFDILFHYLNILLE